MRLINAHTRQSKEFFDADVPEYAILSHTWETDELLYDDFIHGQGKLRPGYRKLSFLCTQAIEDGIDWVWLDTCCINKDSSAELSEAINSMFRWYERARCCYAYLSDFHKKPRHDVAYESALSEARWFTRGWCLQELIAPRIVIFYDSTWDRVGDRLSLSREVSQITGIREEVLREPQTRIKRCSVSEKMSWAASRMTSRVEDAAYCLLGIFEVNMPMLYGEGTRAFQRLQEEIIKATNDHSIFLWDSVGPSDDHLLLAPDPDRFRSGGLFVLVPSLQHVEGFTLGNTGLRISLPLLSVIGDPEAVEGILGCRYRDDYENIIILGLRRRKVSEELKHSAGLPSALFVAPTPTGNQRYVTRNIEAQRAEYLKAWPTVTISRDIPYAEAEAAKSGMKYYLDTGANKHVRIVSAYPNMCFNRQTCVMDLSTAETQYGAVLVSLGPSKAQAVGITEKEAADNYMAVVFGGWTAPGKVVDSKNGSIGIFGIVPSSVRNLENSCRLKVSRSIHRSVNSTQEPVAWVRSSESVPWIGPLQLQAQFRGVRETIILRDTVNIISLSLLHESNTLEVPRPHLHRGSSGSDINPMGVERLRDVVRSLEEDGMEARSPVGQGSQDVFYELEDDSSWRARARSRSPAPPSPVPQSPVPRSPGAHSPLPWS